MKRTIETKFFEFSQNNSGGSFYIDEKDGIAESVIVEAVSAQEAIRKMSDITEEYTAYCECCGERWSTYIDDEDGKTEPSIYDKPVQEALNDSSSYWRKNAAVHYYDGTIKWFVKEENDEKA